MNPQQPSQSEPALDAPNEGGWVPLADGQHGVFQVGDNGDLFGMLWDDEFGEPTWLNRKGIPDNYRLCQWVQPQTTPQAVPVEVLNTLDVALCSWTVDAVVALALGCGHSTKEEAQKRIELEKQARAWLATVKEAPQADVPVEALQVNEYNLWGNVPYEIPVTLRRQPQREGLDKWAIYRNGNALNRDGEWEWEPSPSNRDDEYLARCRFDSVDEALQHWHTYNAKQQRPTANRSEGNGD